jgi:hypothetical protein
MGLEDRCRLASERHRDAAVGRAVHGQSRDRSREHRIRSRSASVAGDHTPQQWFNTSCFALPAPFTFGSASRNSVVAPGYADVDVGLQKDVALPHGARLEVRWEIFNLLNHVNLDVPNRTAFTPNFGRIFSALPARQMQLVVKILF